MALSYRFFEEHNLVVMTGSGTLTAQDFKDYIIGYLCNNSSVKSGFLELGDMRTVGKNVITRDEMLEIVKLDETTDRPQPKKLAFVTSNDAEFGAARQYALNVDVRNKEVDVFRSMDEAKKWLGVEDSRIE